MAKPTVAVFDFDGTLTTQDSFLPFVRWTHSKRVYWQGLLKHSPMILSYAIGQCSNDVIKEKLLIQFYQGWTVEQLRHSAFEYSQKVLPDLLLPDAVDRLKWHQAQNHKIVLVSAALSLYLDPWAQSMNIEHVLATHLDVVQGYITGKLKGKNCYGLEKVKRLEALLGSLKDYYLYAYGDSKGDLELLRVADKPYYREFGKRRLFMVR